MKRVRVKICGISRVADLEIAVDAGADAIGFVVDVPESPRSVSLARAHELIDATPPFVQSVVVSVFQTVSHLRTLCALAPGAVQLAGPLPRYDAIADHVRGTHVIRVITVNDHGISAATLSASSRFDAVLTDSHAGNAHGGTGRPHNWAVSQSIRERIAPTPLILAGGLTPANVKAAIATVGPYAVDVSSGVETSPGIKDHAKIQSFVHAVMEAASEL